MRQTMLHLTCDVCGEQQEIPETAAETEIDRKHARWLGVIAKYITLPSPGSFKYAIKRDKYDLCPKCSERLRLILDEKSRD